MRLTKHRLITLLLILYTGIACSQTVAPPEETVTRTSHDRANITEKYSVLKSDKKTKQGLYQAYFDNPKTTLAASGMYDHGKKVGVWHYYDWQGNLMQHYDFSRQKLIYSVIDKEIRCTFDTTITTADTTTLAVKIGGGGYGYYDMIMAQYNNVKWAVRGEGSGIYNLAHIFNINTEGKLTAYRLVVTKDDFKKEYDIDPAALFEDDLLFVPATLNGKPVASTITLTTTMKISGPLNRF